MQATAILHQQVLTLSTGRCTRVFAWNNGHLCGQRLVDVASGHSWDLRGDVPDLQFPGVSAPPTDGTLQVDEVPASPVRQAHLAATVTTRLGTLAVRRVFRLWDGCPAITSELYLRGSAPAPWRAAAQAAGDARNVEDQAQLTGAAWKGPVTERLRGSERHWQTTVVRFRDITDLRTNLVVEERSVPYRAPQRQDGNLLIANELLTGAGYFLLKEAPCSDVQLAPSGADFIVSRSEALVLGCGLDPADLDPSEWRRAYGTTVGVGQGPAGVLAALRAYQHQRRRHLPTRDDLILVNTWGDRGQDARLGEAFVMRELDACARLGATHLQLDDGWQAGQSSNSATAGGSLDGIWQGRNDYWSVHPQRFPQGLGPVLARAKELGVEIGLWFNPSRDDSYAHWEDDAATLIGLHRDHGVRVFKIDGVYLPDARADRNLRAMFDRVVAATDGAVVFNLDSTAGRRWGFHLGVEYGNLFLENRYTDWGNYFPHWTLRNLWQLARYVPAQALQIEFLNTARNPGKYPADDPLRPQVVPFDYACALTLMAQPLGWFEAQHLPDAAIAAVSWLRPYRAHQAAIHAGAIFPIGEEPTGTAWTGFQSTRGSSGYLLLLREYNDRPTTTLALWDQSPGPLHLTPVLASPGVSTAPSTITVDATGHAAFSLPTPFSYALYRYTRG